MIHIVWGLFFMLSGLTLGYAYYIEKRKKKRFALYSVGAFFGCIAWLANYAASNWLVNY